MRFFSVHRIRVGVAGLLAGLAAALAVASVAAAAPTPRSASSSSPATSRVTANSCLATLYDSTDSPRATPTLGTVPASVSQAFSVFSRANTPSDTLPAAAAARGATPLAQVLRFQGAAAYDPAATRLLSSDGQASIYLIPVTMRPPVHLASRCAHVSNAPELSAAIALENDQIGSGPGLCALSYGSPDGTSPVRVQRFLDASCVAISALNSYWGVTELTASLGQNQYVVTPDAVASLNVSFADTSRLYAAATDNLVPITVQSPQSDEALDAGRAIRPSTLRRIVAAALPTSVVALDTSGTPTVSDPRPADAISLWVDDLDLFRATAMSPSDDAPQGFSVSASGGGGSSPSLSADCTAQGRCTSSFTLRRCDNRTRRCQTTLETTRCSAAHLCRTSIRHGSARETFHDGQSSESSTDGSGGGSVSYDTRVRVRPGGPSGGSIARRAT